MEINTRLPVFGSLFGLCVIFYFFGRICKPLIRIMQIKSIAYLEILLIYLHFCYRCTVTLKVNISLNVS